MWWIEESGAVRCTRVLCTVLLSTVCLLSCIYLDAKLHDDDGRARTASLACTAKSLSRYIHSTLWASLRRLRFRRQRIQKVALVCQLLHYVQPSYQLTTAIQLRVRRPVGILL